MEDIPDLEIILWGNPKTLKKMNETFENNLVNERKKAVKKAMKELIRRCELSSQLVTAYDNRTNPVTESKTFLVELITIKTDIAFILSNL